jgi:PAS domain S-box-containing protein
MVVTDLLIGFAYLAISLTLWALIRKIRAPSSLIIVCFGVFIGACGATHFMEVWTLWHPDYWVAAGIKVVTAIASVGTGLYLFRLRHVLASLAESAKLSEQRRLDLEALAKQMETSALERTRELETLASRLTRVSSATDLGIWYCDLPFNILNWSKKTKEHFWLPEDAEVTMDTFYEHIHPEDRDRTRLAIDASVDDRKAYDIEIRTIDPLVPEVWKWVRAVGWTAYDGSGKPLSFDGITLDLTVEKKTDAERIQANDRLKVSERRYATLASAIPQLVWTCLPDGRCNYLSQQWEDYTGIQADEQLDLAWLDRVIHPDDRERTLQHWQGAISGRHSYDIEYRIKRFDGEYRWFQARGTPMRDENGQILYWVGTCTDIQNHKTFASELNEARVAAERANGAKSQFLANMSHEIRTPIGAITGFAEMLNQPGHSESDRQNFTSIIERNSRHLLRLIDDILDLSKVEAGKIVLENANFNLNDFLTEFDAVMSLKAAEKGIRFVLNVETRIPDQVIGDPLRLKQILSNVAGNAVKFTIKGHVKTDFSYGDGVLRITVTDTGIGIAEEDIGNLFKPFSQADPSLTRKFGGTGLGLILSKRLANHLGGDLALEKSETGKGTRFVATVNLKASPESSLVGFNAPPPAEVLLTPLANEGGILTGMTVLLVEDSPDNRILIATYLKKSGAKLMTANDGQEGYQSAMKSLPDVVLMDIQMPKMDGHEATKKLRAAGFTKPIIALTAHAMREERDRCFESGCSDYLTKPLQRELLIETISKYKPGAPSRI